MYCHKARLIFCNWKFFDVMIIFWCTWLCILLYVHKYVGIIAGCCLCICGRLQCLTSLMADVCLICCESRQIELHIMDVGSCSNSWIPINIDIMCSRYLSIIMCLLCFRTDEDVSRAIEQGTSVFCCEI